MSIQDVKQKLTDISKGLSNVKAGLAELDTSKAPAIDSGQTALSSLISGLSSNDITPKINDTFNTIFAQKQASNQQTAQAKTSLLQNILGQKKELAQQYNPTDMRKQALTEAYSMWGLTPEAGKEVASLQGELAGYSKQLADMEGNKKMGLANIEQRLAGRPGAIVRGEQAIYEKQQNARIARTAAEAGVVAQQLQAKMGLLKQAEQTTDKIVKALTYEYEQKVNDLNWVKDTYSDVIDTWSKDEKDTFNLKLREAEKELDQKRADHKAVLGLMLKYGNAGISVNDTPDEAYRKAAIQAGIDTSKAKSKDWSLKVNENTGQYYWVNTKTQEVKPVEFPQWVGVVEKDGKKTYLSFTSKQEALKWSNITGLPVNLVSNTSLKKTAANTPINKPYEPYNPVNLGQVAESTPQAFVQGNTPTNKQYILDLFGK